MPARVEIRDLSSYEDMRTVTGLQRSVYGHPEVDLMPAHFLKAMTNMGAIILGAFLEGRMAGFVASFPAVFRGMVCQYSHLLGVLPDCQGHGIGKRLKLAQRERALKRGHDLIVWTFDPLQTRNANLNLQALGAFSRTYLPDYYGTTPALCLARDVPTDRLLIEWPIKARSVAARIAGKSPEPARTLNPEKMPKALERNPAGPAPFFKPRKPDLALDGRTILVEVPKDIRALCGKPELVLAWQAGLRKVLVRYFATGYTAGRFLHGERCYYVVQKRKRPRKG